MKINDLKRYKPLDITELSGSPWNNAEKVLGLDENDKVIMAEPDGVVTPEYVDDAVNQAMEAETARTEDAYAKKDEIPDMEDYYTKEEVDEAISGITVDLSDYYTKDETDQAISAATQDLASTDYVDDAIAAIPPVDLSGYAKTTAVTQDIQTAMASETARTESTYAKPSQIPSLDGYATEDWVEEQGYLTEHQDLSAYAKTTAVTEDIQTAMAAETGRTESVYAKKSEIPSLDGYATQAWTTGDTESRIASAMASETARTESTYLKEHQSLDNYYTKSEVDADFVSAATAVGQAIDAAVQGLASETYVDNAVSGLASEDYVDNAVTSATEGLASESYVDAAITSATQNLATEEYVVDAIATAITIDDQLSTGSTNPVQNQVITNALDNKASKANVDANTNARYFPQWNSDGIIIGKFGNIVYNVGHNINGSTYYILRNKNSGALPTIYAPTSAGTQGQVLISSGDGEPVWSDNNFVTSGDVANQIDTAMSAETARTESTYLKEHQSLDNYYTKSQVDAEITGATEDMATKTWVGQQGYLTQHQDISGKVDKTDFNTYTGATQTVLAGKLDATAYTVDNAIDSASTNPVENRAINAALNGVTSSTQMEISSVDSTIQLQYRFYGNPNSNYMNANFKETNIDGYYVIDLGDLPVGGAQNISELRLSYIIINNTYYAFENYSPDTSNLGQKVPLSLSGTYLRMILGSLGDTYDYYLVLKANEDYVFLSATLPSIETISDHKANVSDLPTAQDGSGFNQFVYNGSGNKAVLSKFSPNYRQNITSSYRQSQFAFNITTWGGSASQYFANLPKGNECIDGVKTDRDSQVISKAEEALNGFSEQITLTLGSRSSTDKINMVLDFYLYETNYPRYLVIPTSEGMAGMIQKVILSGTTYYVQNPISQDNYRPVTGKYQLGTRNTTFTFNKEVVGNTYIIIDTELLTLEIADSLTITRAKNIQEAFDNIPAPDMSDYVSKDELTGSTEQQAIEIGADDTSVTISIYGPNGLETLNLKSTSVNKYKVLDISGWATSTNVWPQYFTYSGSQMGFQDFVVMVPDTPYTLTQGEGNHSQITFSGTSPTYLVLNIEDNTVYVSDNLPSVVVEVPGVLDDYAKTTDIPVVPTNVSAFNNDAGYLTQHQDLSAYAKTTAVTEDIASAIAAETARTESTYLKEHQDISGKLNKTDFNTYTGATETALAEKLDASAYTIDNAIDSASTNPVENRVVANALDNKAEKTNVDANTNSRYFPLWNSDGAVIGKCGNIVYKVSFSINGYTYSIYRDKNGNGLPSIYAPISPGTQGQILVSTGGKPVWSDNNFVTSGDVATQIGTAIESETARTESTYAKPSQIPSLNGYATEQWVQNQGYLTQHQSLAEYYTKTEIDGMIGDIESLLASI